MSRLSKFNVLLSLALAVVFSVFFMYFKHDPKLSPIAPFTEDPYDAVGSFADEAVIVLSLLALFRAFRPQRPDDDVSRGQLLLARTELAVPLAVLLTIASNTVAIARQTSAWAGASAAGLLLALHAGMAIVALFATILILLPVRRNAATLPRGAWTRATMISAGALLGLGLYPEGVRESVPGALVTVVVGALFLFASLWGLGAAILPDPQGASIGTRARSGWGSRGAIQWGVVLFFAIAIGLLLVAAESREGGGAPIRLAQLLFIGSVYVGLEISAVLIAFVFIRKWLGLFE